MLQQIIGYMDKLMMRRQATSVQTKDIRSKPQREGLPGKQARSEGEDTDSKEDDSTADGEVRRTPSENHLKRAIFGSTYTNRSAGKTP